VTFTVGDVVMRRVDCLVGVVEEVHLGQRRSWAAGQDGTAIGVRMPDGNVAYGVPAAFELGDILEDRDFVERAQQIRRDAR